MLPPVPTDCPHGETWMRQAVKAGWKIRFNDGERVYGRYPDIIVAFYSNASEDDFGMAVFDRGKVTVRSFPDYFGRRKAAEEYLVSPFATGPRPSV